MQSNKLNILESFDPIPLETPKTNIIDSLLTLFQTVQPAHDTIPDNKLYNIQVPSDAAFTERKNPLLFQELQEPHEQASSLENTKINRNYWMRDETVKECYECKQQFTTFRRFLEILLDPPLTCLESIIVDSVG